MNEIWKDIDGYEGLYEVSNLGRIKSLRDKNGNREKILKTIKDKDGYLKINLWKEDKMKTFRVHRLVATAFISNPNNLPTVNHIDENKENNVADNLEWMNLSQQQRHGTCQQRRVEKLTNGVLSKQVYQYTKDEKLVAIWKSVNECKRNGFCKSHISACCNGKLKSHKGYIWSYTEINQK